MLIEDFERWFENPEFWEKYRPLMFDPDRMVDTPLEVDSMAAFAGISEGAKVLDLCCGYGRHSIEFASRGYEVTGVDITDVYLDSAIRDASEAGLKIDFRKEDVRKFRRSGHYDFAYNFFTSFGYFDDPDDDLIFCKNACDSLKPGGSFLIDTIGKETVALHFQRREWFKRDGFCIMLEYSVPDGWTHIENRWLFVSDSHDDPGILHETVFRHRLYSAVEMAQLLTEAGFSEVRFYGAIDGRPYDHRAERMIAVGVK